MYKHVPAQTVKLKRKQTFSPPISVPIDIIHPQWSTADAEIEDPPFYNVELKVLS